MFLVNYMKGFSQKWNEMRAPSWPALVLPLWTQVEDGVDQLQNKTTCINSNRDSALILFYSVFQENLIILPIRSLTP